MYVPTDKVTNYIGIALLITAYEVHTAVLNERLKNDIEEKNILPVIQAGNSRITVDNIYLHITIHNRKRKNKIVKQSIHVDLEAAFDKFTRTMLWRTMKARVSTGG